MKCTFKHGLPFVRYAPHLGKGLCLMVCLLFAITASGQIAYDSTFHDPAYTATPRWGVHLRTMSLLSLRRRFSVGVMHVNGDHHYLLDIGYGPRFLHEDRDATPNMVDYYEIRPTWRKDITGSRRRRHSSRRSMGLTTPLIWMSDDLGLQEMRRDGIDLLVEAEQRAFQVGVLGVISKMVTHRSGLYIDMGIGLGGFYRRVNYDLSNIRPRPIVYVPPESEQDQNSFRISLTLDDLNDFDEMEHRIPDGSLTQLDLAMELTLRLGILLTRQ